MNTDELTRNQTVAAQNDLFRKAILDPKPNTAISPIISTKTTTANPRTLPQSPNVAPARMGSSRWHLGSEMQDVGSIVHDAAC